MALGGLVLGSPILYFKGRRRMMFQLSGSCYNGICKRSIGDLGFGLRDMVVRARLRA